MPFRRRLEYASGTYEFHVMLGEVVPPVLPSHGELGHGGVRAFHLSTTSGVGCACNEQRGRRSTPFGNSQVFSKKNEVLGFFEARRIEASITRGASTSVVQRHSKVHALGAHSACAPRALAHLKTQELAFQIDVTTRDEGRAVSWNSQL